MTGSVVDDLVVGVDGIGPALLAAAGSRLVLAALDGAVIGLGLGPLTTGLLSDLYAPRFGVDSLRYAMLTVGVLGSPAVVLYLLAARHLPADLARSAARSPVE